VSPSLPDRPNLEQLRKQAKDLLKAHRKGDASICPILRHLSRFAASSDEDVLKAKVKLSEAQHALAREYGFRNWAALVRCVRKNLLRHRLYSLTGAPLVEIVESSGALGTRVSRNVGSRCKCALCDKPATIHVTDKSEGKMVERHYCADHPEANVLIPEGKHRFVLQPAKYVVTVSLTQDQLDRQQAVPVTLPNGSVVQWRFPRGAVDGLVVFTAQRLGSPEKYGVCFILKIIPPPAER